METGRSAGKKKLARRPAGFSLFTPAAQACTERKLHESIAKQGKKVYTHNIPAWDACFLKLSIIGAFRKDVGHRCGMVDDGCLFYPQLAHEQDEGRMK